MGIVRDCMFPDITTLSPTTTLLETIRRLVRNASGFAVVLDNMVMLGMVTEFDVIRWLVKGFDTNKTRIGDFDFSPPITVHENTPCQELIQIYNQRRFRRFPVLNDDELLSGGITEKQILTALPRSNLMAHYRVSDMTEANPPFLGPDVPYVEAAHAMVKWHRGCVLVCAHNELQGMITEGDMLQFRLSEQWDPQTPLSNLVQPAPATIEPEKDLLYVLDFFIRIGHRFAPIVTGQGKLTGLLSQTDLLRKVADSARSHQAVLNPEDIREPAIWFEPEGNHRILAMNEKGAETLELDPKEWIGQPIANLAVDPAIWGAISTLLHSSGTINRIQLPLRSGRGHGLCMACRFRLVHTPTGENRVFWTLDRLEKSGETC